VIGDVGSGARPAGGLSAWGWEGGVGASEGSTGAAAGGAWAEAGGAVGWDGGSGGGESGKGDGESVTGGGETGIGGGESGSGGGEIPTGGGDSRAAGRSNAIDFEPGGEGIADKPVAASDSVSNRRSLRRTPAVIETDMSYIT